MSNEFIKDLEWRGLVSQITNKEGLLEHLSAGPVTLYCGFDPTADSLHVGSLVPLLTLARFQQAGHRVIPLLGGGTGLIGDPSGKSAERNLQSEADVAVRSTQIKAQIARFVKPGVAAALFANNLDWMGPMGLMAFLRDVGKHFSVNSMVHRDSVRSRLERDGEGISFTEFSYMLLQAFDFLTLFERDGCTLQIGGSDQWGNMCSGVDLVRRKHGKEVFALTLPLLLGSDGQKFGKTAKGAVWLDSQKTSVWDFYQFWFNVSDEEVVPLLKKLTFLSRPEIEALEHATQTDPAARKAQQALASHLTTLVHGEAATKAVEEARGSLFHHQAVLDMSSPALDVLSEALPCVTLKVSEHTTLVQFMVSATLAPSLTAARKLVASNAVKVNDLPVTDPEVLMASFPLISQRGLLVRKGKKTFAVGLLGF